MSSNEQLQLAFHMIEDGVNQIRNSDAYQRYLKVMSKFHDYSVCNSLLIYAQCPHATYIAGYRAWQNLFKRYVIRGSKAIKIIAPFKVKKKKDENTDDAEDDYFIKYKAVNVFDISQTIGKPLPELVSELKGDDKSAGILLESFKELANDIDIQFKDPSSDQLLRSGAKGYYDIKNKRIIINKDLSINHQLKTLIHEYAHSILHNENKGIRKQQEVEAESIAFVVCHAFGLDTSEYSFGYITSWSEGLETEKFKMILNDIQSKADSIIEKVKPIYYKKMEEEENEKEYQ